MILTTTPETDSRIRSWCTFTNQPPETFVLQALNQALDDWDDYLDALRISSQVDNGNMQTFSLKEVEAHLDALEN